MDVDGGFTPLLDKKGDDHDHPIDEYSTDKGPFKNYVILLWGEGDVTKRLHKITRGDTPKDYIGLQGGVGQLGSTLA